MATATATRSTSKSLRKKSKTLADFADRVSTLPENMLLGYLLWYTVSDDFHLSHSEFITEAVNHGVDHNGILPAAPFASDVYRRAVKANDTRVMTEADGSKETFLVRRFKDGHQIVRERHSPTGKKLMYRALANLHFDRPSETIILTKLEEAEKDPYMFVAEDISREIRSHFNYWRHAIGSASVRYFIRGILDRWHAISVRQSGGVYYLLPGHRSDLGALSAFLEAVTTRPTSVGRAEITVVPQVSDEHQQALIQNAYEDEAVGEVERMIAEVTDLLKDKERKISQDKAYDAMERYQRMTGKAVEFRDGLGAKVDHVQAALEVLQNMMPALMERVK